MKYLISYLADRKTRTALLAAVLAAAISGCAGTIIETTSDAAIAVAKTPFKVGGAIIDVIDGDDED